METKLTLQGLMATKLATRKFKLKGVPIPQKYLDQPLIKELMDTKLMDVKFVYSLLREFEFFKKFLPEILDTDAIQILRNLRIHGYRPNQAIFRQQDQSNNQMYVCLVGRVGVYIRRKQPLYEGDIGQKVNELTVGQAFGEKALLNESTVQVRSATCVAIEECVILSLDKSTFLGLIQQVQQDTAWRLNFLREVIPHLDEKISENLIYTFKDHICEIGYPVTTEQQRGTWIYFLVSGEVQLTKNQAPIAILDQESKLIIGDELFHSPYYQYTATVTSVVARFFKIELSTILSKLSDDSIASIKSLYHTKAFQRTQTERTTKNKPQGELNEDRFRNSFLDQIQHQNQLDKIRGIVVTNLIRQKTKTSGPGMIKKAQRTIAYERDKTIKSLIDGQWDNLEDVQTLKTYLAENNYIPPKVVSLHKKSPKHMSLPNSLVNSRLDVSSQSPQRQDFPNLVEADSKMRQCLLIKSGLVKPEPIKYKVLSDQRAKTISKNFIQTLDYFKRKELSYTDKFITPFNTNLANLDSQKQSLASTISDNIPWSLTPQNSKQRAHSYLIGRKSSHHKQKSKSSISSILIQSKC